MNHWQRVQELFDATVALNPADRARLLDEMAQGDGELVREVEALVQSDGTPIAAFDRSATELLQQLREEAPAEVLCGQSFGAYHIDEYLSSGGMAHVYRATRTSAGTERRVALKVLRPSLDTAAFLERFQQERETLAGLEHEHVVSFLDAGTLPDGRPYLVMEFIDGVPLTTWSEDASLAERLELFLQVLATVQYAHRQLIVHRDLKPSNVLVTSHGIPKLLDFGVATVLESEQQGARVGGPLTPAYASPEQLRGDPVSAASDIFSLGVLLHELVAGDLPRPGPESPTVEVEGDLGFIVLKALSAEPAQRYRSADQMAEDLRRYLSCQPVSARPDTGTYRSALWVRRNRWPMVLAAAVVLALVVGWIGSDLDRRLAEKEASAGWGAHAQARVLARVFEGWIATVAAADSGLADDAVLHLERVLRDDLDGCLEAEAMVRLALARLHLERGDPETALPHIERARDLAQSTRGLSTSDLRQAESLRDRALASL